MEEINVNCQVEIRVITTVIPSTNRPDIVIQDKARKERILMEVGISSYDQLLIVEIEEIRKYDILAKEMDVLHGCRARMPYVMSWDKAVTKFHGKYSKMIESYAQCIVLRKTFESISNDYRRGIVDNE